jgi:outer membrane receptor protein involved in Fe transport
VALGALSLVPVPAAAQAGAIAGQVVEVETGAPLAGASVEVVGADRRTLSQDNGRFLLRSVPVGTHRLRVTLLGYGELERAVEVAPGRATAVRITLSTEALEVGGIRVVGRRDVEAALERTVEEVEIVELSVARVMTLDLGEVLTRTEGVSVRRTAGLGSGTQISLAGLTDDQVRFFYDGLPLRYAGYPFGLANVPVNLVENVEVFKGVVPVRFGADALGGAVNLVPEALAVGGAGSGVRGTASYQLGSFGTQRVTVGARHVDEGSGLFLRGSGYFDEADNDYAVDVEVPSTDPATRGQPVPVSVERFNDAYRAAGGTVEAGVQGRSWADRLSLRVFGSDFEKGFQNNRTMARPYGEVSYGARTAGGTLRYIAELGGRVTLDAVTGYTYQSSDFVDVSRCIFDWLGECVRERTEAGEIDRGQPRDETLFEHVSLGRVNLGWSASPRHALQLSVAPTLVYRSGEDRLRDEDQVSYYPVTARRDLLDVVSGIELRSELLPGRLDAQLFAKSYVQQARSAEPVQGGFSRQLDNQRVHFGGGAGARYALRDGVAVKASYEYATRLPRADEIFGDVVDTNANLDLEPEVSHNVNLGVAADAVTGTGAWRGEVTGFLRLADNLILPLPAFGERFRNENVFAAHSAGVEASARWSSPGGRITVSGNSTYLDFRNRTDFGPFAPFDGDRIPNRPFAFANGDARVQEDDLFLDGDRLTLSWDTRYVHEFFEFWESAGTRSSKRVVPSQLLHNAGLTYRLRRGEQVLSWTAELTNLSDARAFDFYGAQRPGRAFFVKMSLEF